MIIFVFSVIVLLSTYIIEYVLGISPCVLCVLQRWMLVSFVLFYSLSYIKKLYIYGHLFGLLSSLLGAMFAIKHVWSQYFVPPSSLSCSMPIEFIFDKMPILYSLKYILFNNTIDCSKLDVELFGLSISVWSLMTFIILLIHSSMYILNYFELNFPSKVLKKSLK